MNRVLARQLRRLGLSAGTMPTDVAAWGAFLDRIGAHYDQADRARYLLERSMGLSSREMQELNDEIHELSRRDLRRSEQLSSHDFHESPVASWIEDFRRAVARLDGLRADGVEDLRAHLAEHPSQLRDLIACVEVIDCNRAVCDLVGADRESLLGPVDTTNLGAESLLGWQEQFEAIWDGVGQVEVEFTGHRADETPFEASLKWSVAQIDGAFDYSRVMVVIIDISDRIAAEERMRDLVTAKDEFLASVSHELRTPLTSIVGYAELLREDGHGSSEKRQMIETIAQQAADLAGIVDDLLVGARAELGQLRVALDPFDVATVMESVAATHPDIRMLPAPDGVAAIGDSGRVRQIMRNLISNAKRYGGSDIEIGVTDAAADGAVVLRVSDDGEALTPEMGERIFDRYFRRDSDRARPSSVGVGLTISRELARRMGGELTYRHDGRRAHFELRLQRGGTALAAAS